MGTKSDENGAAWMNWMDPVYVCAYRRTAVSLSCDCKFLQAARSEGSRIQSIIHGGKSACIRDGSYNVWVNHHVNQKKAATKISTQASPQYYQLQHEPELSAQIQ